MIEAYENDDKFMEIRKLSNLKSLKDFQEKMNQKIKNMAKIFEISPSLEEKFEIAIINIRPVISEDGKETFETKMIKYDSKNSNKNTNI